MESAGRGQSLILWRVASASCRRRKDRQDGAVTRDTGLISKEGHISSRITRAYADCTIERLSIWSVFTPPQRTNYKRECDDECTDHPAMVEPKRVDARPLGIEPRVGYGDGIAGRRPNKRLLGRINDAVKLSALIREFKYRIDLSGVRTLEADHSSLYTGCSRGRALIAAID
jgi:hypothetical protein